MLPIVSLCCLALAACPRGAADGSDDTLPPPPTVTTTTTPNYDVPAEIDAAYVERVMKALDHVYGDAVRHLAQSRTVDEEFLKPMVAIHNPRFFGLTQDLWVKTQAQDFAGLKLDPGDPVTRIEKLVASDRNCLLIEGDRDFSPLFTSDDPTNHDRFVALTPLAANRNPGRVNPTPWTINFSGQRDDGSAPDDVCTPQ